MSDTETPVLDAPALRALAQAQAQAQAQAHSGPACPACAALRAPGWEALPGSFDTASLRKVGTLRPPGEEDPTLDEYHPAGTRSWSPEAPIAPAFFPYNRCDVWQCAACGRPFLRYTEYGGYYVEERVREIQAGLVVDAALP